MGKNSKNKRSANRNYSTQQGAGASPAVNLGQPDQNQVDVAEAEKTVEVQELTEVQKLAEVQQPVEVQKEVQQLTEDMVIQFGAHEVSVAEISEKVKKSYLSGEGSAEINKLKIYVKPEDNKAYYVVNDETEGNVELVSD